MYGSERLPDPSPLIRRFPVGTLLPIFVVWKPDFEYVELPYVITLTLLK